MVEENKYPSTPDYKKDTEIDIHNLEIECRDYACRYSDYGDLLAQAIFDRDKAKEALDNTKANLDSSIRTAAAQAQEKVTETIVSNRVLMSPDYMEAMDRFIKAEYVVNVLKNGAVKGMDKKGDRLTDLIYLDRKKYYASDPYPPNPRADQENIDRGREAMSGELAKEMMPETSGQSLPPRPGATTAPPTSRPPLLRDKK